MGAEDPVRRSRAQAADARRSVDVFRISQIASRNVEKEQGDADAGGDYGKQRTGAGGGAGPGGHARVQGGDVALDNTDAEVSGAWDSRIMHSCGNNPKLSSQRARHIAAHSQWLG